MVRGEALHPVVCTVTHGLGHWKGVSEVLQQAENEVCRQTSFCRLGRGVPLPGWLRTAVLWERRQCCREGLEEAGLAYRTQMLF